MLYHVYGIVYNVYCIVGVAQIFRFADFFGVSLHIVEHSCKVSAKNTDDRYPTQNAVLYLPLNNSTSILCSNT